MENQLCKEPSFNKTKIQELYIKKSSLKHNQDH